MTRKQPPGGACTDLFGDEPEPVGDNKKHSDNTAAPEPARSARKSQPSGTMEEQLYIKHKGWGPGMTDNGFFCDSVCGSKHIFQIVWIITENIEVSNTFKMILNLFLSYPNHDL